MSHKLSIGQIIKLPLCINRKELKHPFALNVMTFVLVLCFSVALYYMIPVMHKFYSIIILLLLFYIAQVIAFYLFYKYDHK